MTMVALLLAVAAGHAAAVDLDLYLTAARSGVAGEVAGRAYEERRRLDLSEQPLPGTTVTLLPSPDALLQYLEGVKRDARDSPEAFRSAIPRMLEAQEQHERAVRAAGGDSLVRSAVAAADGTFTPSAGSSRFARATTAAGTRNPTVNGTTAAPGLPRCRSEAGQSRAAQGVVPCARSPRRSMRRPA